MRDYRGGSIIRSGRDEFENELYRETEGNRGTVGGVATDIRSVCRGEEL